MLLNVQDISDRLIKGDEIVVRESSLRSDMVDIAKYYKAIPNPPPGVKPLLETEELDHLKLAEIYFQNLTSSDETIKVFSENGKVTLHK